MILQLQQYLIGGLRHQTIRDSSLKLTGRTFESAKFVVSGAGAAGFAVIKMIIAMGAKDIIVVDRMGIIGRDRTDLGERRKMLIEITNKENLKGTLKDAFVGRDVFIGVSGPGIVSEEMVRSMAKDSIVFALANPEPEIMPDKARSAGAKIVATGRSDFPNQINNALAYPGVFKGALESRAPKITEAMKVAAAKALAGYVDHPTAEALIPEPLDKNVPRVVAEAIKAIQ